MAFSHYRRAKEEVEVNLIPVMNLFVTLIPFLLLAAAFYHVGVIPTSLPAQTDQKSDIAADPRAVTVNLHLERNRIQLSASSAVLDEETLSRLSLSMPRGPEGFDLDLLQNVLFQIKQKYEKSDTVIVLPDAEVEYQDVVMVLDTAREMVVDEGTENEERVPLFPVVVMSQMIKAEGSAP